MIRPSFESKPVDALLRTKLDDPIVNNGGHDRENP